MRLLPTWLARPMHTRQDIAAGLLMGFLALPQSLGYAMLAGLPPITGLYASILPAIIYAWCASSSIQAVGPVALTAVMTASAVGDDIASAPTLAMMVALWLLLFYALGLGFLTKFISRSINQGFVSAAAMLIIISQLKYFVALDGGGDTAFSILAHLWQNLRTQSAHLPTLGFGSTMLLLLFLNKKIGALGEKATWCARFLVLALTVVVMAWFWQMNAHGISMVGALPAGTMSKLQFSFAWHLLFDSFMVALIAFLSGNAVAQSVALARKERYAVNQELGALGLANIASALVGAFPVAGGLSRTSLNISLGAKSQLATLVAALTILILMQAGGVFAFLPKVLLSAIIVVSAVALIDFGYIAKAWRVCRADAYLFVLTFIAVSFLGLSIGLGIGVGVSLCWAWRRGYRLSTHAQLSQHGNSVQAHDLYFANAEDCVNQVLALSKPTLIAPSNIDFSTFETLRECQQQGVHVIFNHKD